MARGPARNAVLKGMRAALRLQRDLGLDRGQARGHRVDVFGAIYKENVPLLFRELTSSQKLTLARCAASVPLGSSIAFAAPATSGGFRKPRRSLHGARTGKMRTKLP